MTGQLVGYVRVSTKDQNPARQLHGRTLNRLFTDVASGRDAQRPELEALLSFVRDGDTMVIESMDRLARNLDDLRRIVFGLVERGVRVEFAKEGLVFDSGGTPMSSLLLSVMGAFAEFERALILERQSDGIALAKERGVYKGRTPALTPTEADLLRQQANQGVAKTVLAEEFGVSRETVYRYLRAVK